MTFSMDMQISSGDAQGNAVGPAVISAIGGYQQKITEITGKKLHELLLRTFMDIVSRFPHKSGETSNAFKFNILGPMKFEIAVEGQKAVMVFNFIEYGTKAHGPKTAKMLHFIADDGTEVFTKWVRGIPAHYIVRFALEKLSGEIDALVKEVDV